MIVDRISAELGLRRDYLQRLATTASHRYKTYSIKKRTGGFRTIDHPSRELKLVQHWLAEKVLCHLPVHPAATAYKPHSSIVRNAKRHLRQGYLLRIDFRNFFPSITAQDIEELLRRNSEYLEKRDPLVTLRPLDISFIVAIVCKNGKLTIGAPTSPLLSNAVMFEFDRYWYAASRQQKVVYSRYADDLFFSTKFTGILSHLLEDVREYLRYMDVPTLSINEPKTVFTSRKRKRVVTGVTLTSENKISLGRARKRRIRSLVYNFGNNKLTNRQVVSLRGLIAFAESVEPSFVSSVRQKFGQTFQVLVTPPPPKAKAATAKP